MLGVPFPMDVPGVIVAGAKTPAGLISKGPAKAGNVVVSSAVAVNKEPVK